MDVKNLPRPQFVLFDYGETLGHEADYRPEAGFQAILEHADANPREVNGEELCRIFRGCFHDLRRQVLKLGVEMPNAPRWRWLFEICDLRFSLTLSQLETIFWNAAAPCAPTPGAAELLSRLRALKIPTAVISNLGFGGEALKARLEGLFPEHSFDFVLSSADYALRKPNPHLFQLIQKKCGCAPEEIWFLGDNPEADISGAKNAGFVPIYYDRDLGCAYRQKSADSTPPPCIRIEDLTELFPRMDDWKQ